MTQTVTDAQRDMALRILTTAIAILRDDQSFDPAHTIFGLNFAAAPRRGSTSTKYSFENPAFPRAHIALFVTADPLDYTTAPTKVRQVPTSFTIWFSPLMEGISRSTLEDLFPLDIGYWIDSRGNRRSGNDIGATPPQVRLHGYRYRASDQPTSRFTVDVELAFGDPDPMAADENELKTAVLMAVILTRNYSMLKPERRKQSPR
ncbi:hypothetical protein [Paraburkholderia sp. ZP32-5]|uniref:hypothetical protein n=1 Tax=Paraburkholderia sp. ZP32-5 TaxID=2883245 RepID=UPI001F302977|nr:hypothetical protein [Paraburkholderia sp. ZP32-5]